MPQPIRNDPVLSVLWKRANLYDQNALVAVLGGTGTRKSGSTITMALLLDPTFNLDRIVFTPSAFMDLIQKGDPIRDETGKIVTYHKLKKGSVIIWDETGIENDNTEWFTMKSKVIKWTFTTMRYRNHIIFLTSPTFAMLSIGLRRLVHAILIMKGLPKDSRTYPRQKFAEGFFRWLDVNSVTGKIYTKRPHYWDDDGDSCSLDSYIIGRPPHSIEDAYKMKKDEQSKNWYATYQKELNSLDKQFLIDADRSAVDERDIKEKILKEKEKFMLEQKGKQRFMPTLISQVFSISEVKAKFMAKVLNDSLDKGIIHFEKKEGYAN